jgi:hypothetical protein
MRGTGLSCWAAEGDMRMRLVGVSRAPDERLGNHASHRVKMTVASMPQRAANAAHDALLRSYSVVWRGRVIDWPLPPGRQHEA